MLTTQHMIVLLIIVMTAVKIIRMEISELIQKMLMLIFVTVLVETALMLVMTTSTTTIAVAISRVQTRLI